MTEEQQMQDALLAHFEPLHPPAEKTQEPSLAISNMLYLHLPQDLAELVKQYAPYWMDVGKASFVQTLNKIHPDHIRDIWADRAEIVGVDYICWHPPPVVAELLDYYEDLMQVWCADSYAYIPPTLDLTFYNLTRKPSLLTTPRRRAPLMPGQTVIREENLNLQRRRLPIGSYYDKKAKEVIRDYSGAPGRLHAPPYFKIPHPKTLR